MSGRDLVLGVIAILIGGAIWTLSKRAKREPASRFKPWYPER